jgi:integrase
MRISVRQGVVNGRQYWVVQYRNGNVRRRRFVSTRREADRIAAEFRGEVEESGRVWMEMTGAERAEVAVVWAEMKAAGVGLRKVWDEWRAGGAAKRVSGPKKTIGALVAEVVESKRSASRRPKYVEELRSCLARFARGRETMDCAAMTPAMIEEWVNGLGVGAYSRKTQFGRLSTLFSFAKRRGYRPDNPLAAIDWPVVEAKVPRILTVEESAAVLHHCPVKARAWFGLAMFGGIRPEEVDHLGWDAVDLEAGVVRIDATVSKVRQRRLVHLRPGVAAWLARAQVDGAVLPIPWLERRRIVQKVRDAMGWKAWPQDVLRHTATSYWLAVEPDVARLALELGNSPAMIFRHYRELVRREDAERFWGLVRD